MQLTREQLFVILKQAYMKGRWDVIHQTQNSIRPDIEVTDEVIIDILKEFENESL